jgi:hypothetical protein
MALLVSRPGDPPLRAADLTRMVSTLPGALRQRLVAVPYNDQPVAGARLGEVVAAAAGHTIRASTGLVVWSTRGRGEVVVMDRGGTPAWRPFVCELAWRPGRATPRRLSWSGSVGGLPVIGPGLLALEGRWVVELVEAGLWIRPSGHQNGAGLVPSLPLNAEHCVVVVGVPDGDWVAPPWRAIRRLLRELPEDARTRLRFAVPADPGERLAAAAARACGGELAGRPVHVLEPDGEMAPRYVTLPPNRLQARVGWPGAVMRIADHPDGPFTLGGIERADDRARSPRVEPATDDGETLVAFFRRMRELPAFDAPES